MGQRYSQTSTTQDEEAIVSRFMKYKLNQKPDGPSLRADSIFIDSVACASKAPAHASLREHMDEWDVFDQGELGSCTANAIAGAIEYVTRVDKDDTNNTPSRLFIYYNERNLEGTTDQDSGAMIRDGLSSVHTTGYCSEKLWPYDVSKYADKPPDECYEHVKRAVKEFALFPQKLGEIKKCIGMGYPVVIGVAVYESFMSEEVTEYGDVPMPEILQEELLGGHAILIVGYDDAVQRVTFRNSWGEDWGDRGYGTLPYEYFNSPRMANSMWVIKSVSEFEELP